MLFNATHRQDVLHHLSRELNLSSVLLRIASETPTSPMNRQLASRLQSVGMAIRIIKDLSSGTVDVDAVVQSIPDQLQDEVQHIIGKVMSV
jgi:hypothetical protein